MTNKDKDKNTAQVAEGKVKAAPGKASGNGKLEIDSNADQVKGNLK